MSLPINEILAGSALERLKQLPDSTIDCCVTSPPYWALRDYKVEGQLGSEPTFHQYLDNLIEIFAEVKRVIKKTGSIWVNIGDKYGGTKIGNTNNRQKAGVNTDSFIKRRGDIPEKSLCGIPERLAIRMTDELGLIRRNTIIWYKPNCMPSSASDRFTIDFEYIYFFTKSPKYFFETQYEPMQDPIKNTRTIHDSSTYNSKYPGNDKKYSRAQKNWSKTAAENYIPSILGRMKRCVWKISTRTFKEAHFAVYPTQLIEPILKAACPVDGIVLDPFLGSGTTALVALQQFKNFIGIELNSEYIEIANKRIGPLLNGLIKWIPV